MVGSFRQHGNPAPYGDDVSGFYGVGGPVARPVVALASVAGVLTIDLSRGELFTLTLTENITSIIITGGPGAGFGYSFLLWITQHASIAKTVKFPAAFDWDGGAADTVSSQVGAVDLLAVSTRNGTAWDATLSKGRA